jgi:hypothetical protein
MPIQDHNARDWRHVGRPRRLHYTVIVAIFALCGILYWRFRKNGWL